MYNSVTEKEVTDSAAMSPQLQRAVCKQMPANFNEMKQHNSKESWNNCCTTMRESDKVKQKDITLMLLEVVLQAAKSWGDACETFL